MGKKEDLLQQVVDKTYRILSFIGYGGMSTVYLADNMKTGDLAVIKVLKEEIANSRQGKGRFLREVNNARMLEHKNVVRTLGAGEHNGKLYMCMEYMGKGTLYDLLQTAGPFPWPVAIYAMREVARGLEYSHGKEVIHRDMKPENIMVNVDAEVKIADFGISKTIEGTKMTQQGEILGTPAYMSPEQVSGLETDFSTDIYAFGVILYELIIGEHPFIDQNLSQTAMKVLHHIPRPVHEQDSMVPKRLSDLIEKLIAKKPADRPATIEEVGKELEAIMAESPLRCNREQFQQFINNPASIRNNLLKRLATLRFQALAKEYKSAPPKNRKGAVKLARQLLQAMSYGPALRELGQFLEAFLSQWGVRIPRRNQSKLKELGEDFNKKPRKELLIEIVHLQEMAGNSLDVIYYLGLLLETRPADSYIQEKISMQVKRLQNLVEKWLEDRTSIITTVQSLTDEGSIYAEAPRRSTGWIVTTFLFFCVILAQGAYIAYQQLGSPQAREALSSGPGQPLDRPAPGSNYESILRQALDSRQTKWALLQAMRTSIENETPGKLHLRARQFVVLFPEEVNLSAMYAQHERMSWADWSGLFAEELDEALSSLRE